MCAGVKLYAGVCSRCAPARVEHPRVADWPKQCVCAHHTRMTVSHTSLVLRCHPLPFNDATVLVVHPVRDQVAAPVPHDRGVVRKHTHPPWRSEMKRVDRQHERGGRADRAAGVQIFPHLPARHVEKPPLRLRDLDRREILLRQIREGLVVLGRQTVALSTQHALTPRPEDLAVAPVDVPRLPRRQQHRVIAVGVGRAGGSARRRQQGSGHGGSRRWRRRQGALVVG
mmetsp:Transcript_6529/g.16972  ORF Transcript_6529/g.16972 Transcript_6529/m.16972 type:complete len:227 (+) Transcript_6529:1018-1698(+)